MSYRDNVNEEVLQILHRNRHIEKTVEWYNLPKQAKLRKLIKFSDLPNQVLVAPNRIGHYLQQ